MRKEKCRLTVQVVEKTVELLEILATADERLTIGALAVRLGMGRRDTLLLLVTLESRGIVRWDERARIYLPGQRAAEMARQVLALFGQSLVEPKMTTSPRVLPARAGGARKLRPDRRLEAGGLAASAL